MKTQGLVSVPGAVLLQIQQMTFHGPARSPLPQVAGLTDAQTPSNNSSRSKSTITLTWNIRGNTKRSLLQAEAEVVQGICLHSLPFTKILLAGMKRGKSGLYLYLVAETTQ